MVSAATEEFADGTTVGGEPETAYVIRLATVYLVVSHDAQETVEYAARIVSALEEDPRITYAAVPTLDPGWSPQATAYVPIDEDGISGVLEATRHAHVQRFSEPISIQLRVPRKNQPKVFEDDEIPSEDYFVLWDGGALLVAWEQRAEDYVGSSGGHIVEKILEEAADRAGTSLMVQACNPQCEYVFLHTAIRAVVDQACASGWSISQREDNSGLMDLVVSDEDSLTEVSFSVWWRVRASLESFAAMKNRGRQILELERVVRGDLDRLNRLHHERARASHKGLVARVRALWSYRGWRRTSRYYLARLWLGSEALSGSGASGLTMP